MSSFQLKVGINKFGVCKVSVCMFASLQFMLQVYVVVIHLTVPDTTLEAGAVFTLRIAAGAMSLPLTQQMTPAGCLQHQS